MYMYVSLSLSIYIYISLSLYIYIYIYTHTYTLKDRLARFAPQGRHPETEVLQTFAELQAALYCLLVMGVVVVIYLLGY